MACLDNNALVAFVEGSLGEVEHSNALSHIEVCESCRQAVSEAMLAIEPDTGSADLTEVARSGQGGVAFLPGTLIDHYRVERLVGRGGMGEVYRAIDVKLGRPVALKVVRTDLLASEEARERFLFEARATARFNHPNIVSIYGVGDVGEMAYVALEYVEGETLRRRLTRSAPLSRSEVAAIGAPIAAALEEAHRHHILHRDLKPANVFLGEERVRVLDFGLAKFVKTDERRAASGVPAVEDVDLTHTGMLRGTPAYMAPEQWTDAPASGATDVWALGVVLFEMAYRKHPYRDRALVSMQQRVVGGRPIEVPERDALGQLIAHCLAKDETARPTATEVRQRLESLVDVPASPPARSRSMAASWLRLASLATVVLAAAALGIGGAWAYFEGAENTTQPASVQAPPAEPAPAAMILVAEPNLSADAAIPTQPAARGSRRRSRNARRGMRESRAPRESAGPMATAQLAVQSEFDGRPMWANVYVNGTPRGQTPVVVRGLPTGRHRLELRRAGFRTAARTVRLSASRTTRVKLQLRR